MPAAQASSNDREPAVDVLIATPLEPQYVAQIRLAEPRAHVSYEPELLPPVRYPSDHRGDPAFRRDDAGERRFAQLLARADVIFGVPEDSPEALAELVPRSPKLRWIAGTAAGEGERVRRAGLSAEDLSRIVFTSARGVHAEQLAEWSMLGLLAFTKGLPRLLADQRDHRWGHYPVRELRGQRLVVIGLGEIGSEVARLGRAFGMRVTGVRRRVVAGGADERVDELRSTDELPDLVGTADAVVLALPGTDATAGLFGRELIDRLPTHAVVVNVGRGSTVDEPALINALAERRIAGAALDVFATEPLPADSPLWQMDNVLISPHTAALSADENARLTELFCENLTRFIDGKPLHNVIDVEQFY